MLRCLAFIIFVLFQTAVFAAESPYSIGETIHYKITQMGIKSGDATLVFEGPQKIEGKDALLVVFTADGFNFYDQEKIYLDLQTFRPIVVIRDLNIFGNKEKITEYYLSVEHKIKVIKDKGGKITEQVLDKDGEVDNIYGFMYRCRLNNLFEVGKMMDVRLPTKDIKIGVVKQTPLSVMGKKMDSFYMESKPAQYKIWFDVGPNKLPLRISGAMGIANTVMVISDYKE